MKRVRRNTNAPTLFNWENLSAGKYTDTEWKAPTKNDAVELVYNEMMESVRWRRLWVQEKYNGLAKETALFEVDTWEKIINKNFGKTEQIKRTRKS